MQEDRATTPEAMDTEAFVPLPSGRDLGEVLEELGPQLDAAPATQRVGQLVQAIEGRLAGQDVLRPEMVSYEPPPLPPPAARPEPGVLAEPQ